MRKNTRGPRARDVEEEKHPGNRGERVLPAQRTNRAIQIDCAQMPDASDLDACDRERHVLGHPGQKSRWNLPTLKGVN